MDSIGKIINKSKNTVINGNKHKNLNNDIIDNNDTSKKKNKYALDKSKFTPNTPKTQLAEKIANELDDLKNYACFLNVVNKIGEMNAERLLRSTLSDIKEKQQTTTPVRNKARYFMYKYKYKKY